jgi:hypothetical protein
MSRIDVLSLYFSQDLGMTADSLPTVSQPPFLSGAHKINAFGN